MAISDKQRKRLNDRIISRRQKIRDLKNSIRTERGCKFCGEHRYWCLMFHHRDRDTKEFKLGDTGRKVKYFSIEKVLEEIAKCDILCHNCHANLHYLEGYKHE